MVRPPPLIVRAQYEARAGKNLAKARWHKPAIRPILLRGVPALVKDYSVCPLIWRVTYGRAMVMREIVIYGALDGLPGIPRLLGSAFRPLTHGVDLLGHGDG